MKEYEFKSSALGGGYYLLYREELNGLGGYQNVNMMLYRGDEEFVKEISDKFGNFLDYPGTADGEWREKLSGEFYMATRFVSYISRYKGGLALFGWMLQPDGRYWADDEGFGWGKEQEIWLYSLMNHSGDFVIPFTEKEPEYTIYGWTL